MSPVEHFGGFGGQSLVVELWDEARLIDCPEGLVPDSDRGGGEDLNSALGRTTETSFPYLWNLDPYGLTVFNGLQMRAVILELERLRDLVDGREAGPVERVLTLARRCEAEGPHLFLVFIGD